MKSFFLFIFALLSICPAALWGQDTTQVNILNGPDLTFREKNHDFGLAPRDTLLTHIFVFKNNGSDTLHIRGVRPG